MKTVKQPTAENKPTLTVTFHWTGNIPKAIKRKWEAMFKPKTVTFTIPKTKS